MRVALALLPVCLFLASLVYLDSYKLVRLRHIVGAIVAGSVAALLSYAVNVTLVERELVGVTTLSRFVAPFVEELLKALPLVVLLRSGRIGFLVDAAIFGFAIGTGFALAENIYYLRAVADAPPALWLVRGFGTAVMHGGTTATLAMIAKLLADRRGLFTALVPGFAIAYVVHSAFNHFVLPPLVAMTAVMVVLPALVITVFAQSERWLQSWLGRGFDVDSEMLALIHSGELSSSPVGLYLASLREHFPGEILADMLCYLRLHAELSLRAKGILMMREAGFPVERDPDVEEQLGELRYLEKSIGRTGRLALAPVLTASSEDLWQLRMLESG